MEIRDVYTSWLESKSENTRTKYQAKVDNFSEWSLVKRLGN